MKLQANRKDITTEQRSYVAVDFSEAGEVFEGLNVFFVLSQAEYHPEPLLLKDQDQLAVSGDTITVALETSQTGWTGARWYELWVEWAPGQWQKEFKGTFTLTKSANYNG